MSTLKDRINKVRAAAGWPDRGWKARLAGVAGVSRSAVSQWATGETSVMSAEAAMAIERALGWRTAWLIAGEIPERSDRAQDAHQDGGYWINVQKIKPSESPVIKWEDIGMGTPDAFDTRLIDDAMSPRAKSGDLVRISTTIAPIPGDGVLIKDKEGRHYLRIYKERRPGHWEAHAENTDYRPMESDADGLTIIGVLIGTPESRWSK